MTNSSKAKIIDIEEGQERTRILLTQDLQNPSRHFLIIGHIRTLEPADPRGRTICYRHSDLQKPVTNPFHKRYPDMPERLPMLPASAAEPIPIHHKPINPKRY